MVNINYYLKLLFPPSIWDCILQDVDECFCCFIESDPHAQALLQHGVEHESFATLEGAIDDDDEDDARVAHEVKVKEFTQVLEPGQLSEDKYDEAEEHATAEATSSPPSHIHGLSAAAGSETAQVGHGVGVEGEPFTLIPPAEDISDDEMAPPRVTRPLPPAPAPGVSTESAIAPAPAVSKRTSMPPPARAVPVPDHSSLLAPGLSPQRTPSKRASVPPPSREIPVPIQESPEAALSRRQTSIQRTPISPPTRVVPSPSVSHLEPLIAPPPPPPLPNFGIVDQGGVLTGEPEVVQDERISTPPPVLAPKPPVPPLTPEARRSIESRRSTSDSRHSREERRNSGHYPAPSVPVPAPLKKRATTSLVPEQGVLHEDIGGKFPTCIRI